MTIDPQHWVLPQGVDEVLPARALRLESTRREIIDELQQRGFELVMPPIMEFADTLLLGSGQDLDTQTYKFMDHHTQRLLGVRADITPQIARIDAHYLSHNAVNRLCYAGTVLRTQSMQIGGQRELLQVGSEIFGIEDSSADCEIISAMLKTIELCDLSPITLSLNHIGIYRSLMMHVNVDKQDEHTLISALERRSIPDMTELVGSSPELKPFLHLCELQGGKEVLKEARHMFGRVDPIKACLNELDAIVDYIDRQHEDIQLHLDLADISGYAYHTGVKYIALMDGRGQVLAKGGRYDNVSADYGITRPATGFSADLKSLIKFGESGTPRK